MKKLTLLLLGWVVITLPSCAQRNMDFERLSEKYEDVEEVESFGMHGLGCLLASWLAAPKAGEASALLRQVTSFHVLTGEGEKTKELQKDVKSFIRSSRLEELLNIQEEGADIRIYAEAEKDMIYQVFVSVVENEDVVFLQMNGKFDRSTIRKLLKKANIQVLCR